MVRNSFQRSCVGGAVDLKDIAIILSIAITSGGLITAVVWSRLKTKNLPEMRKELANGLSEQLSICKTDSNERLDGVDKRAGSRIENLEKVLNKYQTNTEVQIREVKKDVSVIRDELIAVNTRIGEVDTRAAERHSEILKILVEKGK